MVADEFSSDPFERLMPQCISALVIEQDLEWQQKITDYLTNHDGKHLFETDSVHQIHDALSQLNEKNYDVILVSWNNSTNKDRDPFQRLNQKVPNTPIVILTPEKIRKEAATAVQKGAQAFLVKESLNQETLSQSLRNAVKRKRVKNQLLQSQKMESVGRLAGGVAHDFNNLLSVINGYADLLVNDKSIKSESQDYIREIREAGLRAASLTEQLLAFSRRQIIKPKTCDINELILNLDKMLRRLIGEDIELVMIPGTTKWKNVRVDPCQMETLIFNLAVNARDAMPKGGKLLIETKDVIFDEPFMSCHDEVQAGEYIMVAVSDSGMGMSAEVKHHLFEPFFTTKQPGKGTGLGLALCYGIVKHNRGFLDVYSEIGHGTTFKVYFPLDKTMSRSEGVRKENVNLARGTETILLVEDDASVRNVANRLLRLYGYEVVVAANGEDALGVLNSLNGQNIHLLMTDMIMPLMGGKELALRVKEMKPEAKVLFISGYTEKFIDHSAMMKGEINFLQKPFTRDNLITKVRQVLDQRREEGANGENSHR